MKSDQTIFSLISFMTLERHPNLRKCSVFGVEGMGHTQKGGYWTMMSALKILFK